MSIHLRIVSDCFRSTQQSGIVVKETLWLTKHKAFTIWPLTEKAY